MPQFDMPRTTPLEARMRDPVVRAILEEVESLDKGLEGGSSVDEA